jgi:hypothetical protein
LGLRLFVGLTRIASVRDLSRSGKNFIAYINKKVDVPQDGSEWNLEAMAYANRHSMAAYLACTQRLLYGKQ